MAEDHRTRPRPTDIDEKTDLVPHTARGLEQWAVAQVGAQLAGGDVGDQGIDGVIRFPVSVGPHAREGFVLLAVKGGAEPDPRTVRDLASATDDLNADMAVLVVRGDPTPRLINAAHHAGTYTSNLDGRAYPKIQVLGLDQLLRGDRPAVPTASAS